MIVALPTILSLGLLAFLLHDSLLDWAIERWSDQYVFVESLAHRGRATVNRSVGFIDRVSSMGSAGDQDGSGFRLPTQSAIGPKIADIISLILCMIRIAARYEQAMGRKI